MFMDAMMASGFMDLGSAPIFVENKVHFESGLQILIESNEPLFNELMKQAINSCEKTGGYTGFDLSEALLISTLAHEDIKAIADVYNKTYRSDLGRMAAQNMNCSINLFNKEANFSSQSTASKKCMDLMDKAANDPGMIQASLCALIDYMRDGLNKERTLYRTVKPHLKSNLNKKTQGPDYN